MYRRYTEENEYRFHCANSNPLLAGGQFPSRTMNLTKIHLSSPESTRQQLVQVLVQAENWSRTLFEWLLVCLRQKYYE